MNIGKYSIESGEIVIRLPIKSSATHGRVTLSSTHGRESFIHNGNLIHVNVNVWMGDAVEYPTTQAPIWAVGKGLETGME